MREAELRVMLQCTQIAMPMLVAFLTVAVFHGLLHGLVFQRYGYDVTYGVYWRFGAVYAAVFHQFHSREHGHPEHPCVSDPRFIF